MGLFSHAAVQGGTAAQDTLNRVDEQGRKQGFWRIEAPKVEKPVEAPPAKPAPKVAEVATKPEEPKESRPKVEEIKEGGLKAGETGESVVADLNGMFRASQG